MTIPSKERCEKAVWSGYHDYQCQRRGVNVEGGKRWCKQHTPSLKKAKKQEAMQKWRKQQDLFELLRATNAELIASVLEVDPNILPDRVMAAQQAYKAARA